MFVNESKFTFTDPPLLENLALANAGAGLAVAELITWTMVDALLYCPTLAPLGVSTIWKVPFSTEDPDSTNCPTKLLLVERKVELAGLTASTAEVTAEPCKVLITGVTVTEVLGAEDSTNVNTY